MQADVTPIWIVAGAPGAGKTTVAKALAATLRPPAALLDKDTIFDPLVAAALSAAGRPDGEREGPWYDGNVKVHEYAALAATAAEIRSLGCPVVVCAPYSSQIRDHVLWDYLVADLGGDPVRLGLGQL